MNSVKFLKFFFLWQDGYDKYLTTCKCSPFITCGCWSIKVRLGLLPTVRKESLVYQLEIYAMRLWFSYSKRILHRNGHVNNRLSYGFARRRSEACN